MPLDSRRHSSMLNTICHVYEKLTDHLDPFERVSQSVKDCDCYAVVTNCFDPAIQKFCENPPPTENIENLLRDLLMRIGGLFNSQYSFYDDLLNSFQNYRETVLETTTSLSHKIENFQATAEELSLQWYSSYYSSTYQGLKRRARLNITPAKMTEVSSDPKKSEGVSEIHLRFGMDDFDFKTYINLPFYFFHEYLSHIHAANLFNEYTNQQISSFEDGWLIYVARQKYKKYIRSRSKITEILPCPEEHYLSQYVFSITDIINTRKGYELAREFSEIVGEDRFHDISAQLAATDYDFLKDSFSDLHAEFLFFVKKWIQRLSEVTYNDKKEKTEFLVPLIDKRKPLEDILKFLEAG